MKPFHLTHVSGPFFLSNKVWPERDLPALQQHGIGAIVNLTEDHIYEAPPPMVCLNCGFLDSTYVAAGQLRQIYAFIDQHRHRTHILVHCSAGVSRSAGIVAGQLMRENPGWNWEQALRVVHQNRAVWVSVETRESVLACLENETASPLVSEIQESEAEILRQLREACGVRLQEVGSIGWDTRGFVVENGRVVGLGLHAVNLSALPEGILALKGLRDLYLCDNHLEALPGNIKELSHLRNLNLADNQLASLPGEIGELEDLRVLNLARNRLRTIPDEIQGLSGLDRLYLHENLLTDLPKGIGGLARLTELYLQNNRLVRLPAEIGKLASLQQLSLSGNEIQALPPTICELPNLTTLNLSRNHLRALPGELRQLVQLDNLNVSNNDLTELPDQIAALKRLRRLNIALNRFNVLPISIENWLENLRDGGCFVIREGWTSELF